MRQPWLHRAVVVAFMTQVACVALSGPSAATKSSLVGTSTLAEETNAPALPRTPLELTLARHGGPSSPWHASDDRGRVVLLDVWATWCEPCRDALPVYDELRTEFAARGLSVYAINVDEDGSQIDKFLSETHVQVPVLVDPGAQVVEPVLRVKLMPTAYLVDRRGVVREVHEGFSDDARRTYRKAIEALLAEQP